MCCQVDNDNNKAFYENAIEFLFFVYALTGAIDFLPAVERLWVLVADVASFCLDHGNFLTAAV